MGDRRNENACPRMVSSLGVKARLRDSQRLHTFAADRADSPHEALQPYLQRNRAPRSVETRRTSHPRRRRAHIRSWCTQRSRRYRFCAPRASSPKWSQRRPRDADLVLIDACDGGSQRDALSGLRNGDVPAVGAVISNGVPRFVGRSRNTPATTRKARVLRSNIIQTFSGDIS
jgi:hypothetical protein